MLLMCWGNQMRAEMVASLMRRSEIKNTVAMGVSKLHRNHRRGSKPLLLLPLLHCLHWRSTRWRVTALWTWLARSKWTSSRMHAQHFPWFLEYFPSALGEATTQLRKVLGSHLLGDIMALLLLRHDNYTLFRSMTTPSIFPKVNLAMTPSTNFNHWWTPSYIRELFLNKSVIGFKSLFSTSQSSWSRRYLSWLDRVTGYALNQ